MQFLKITGVTDRKQNYCIRIFVKGSIMYHKCALHVHFHENVNRRYLHRNPILWGYMMKMELNGQLVILRKEVS